MTKKSKVVKDSKQLKITKEAIIKEPISFDTPVANDLSLEDYISDKIEPTRKYDTSKFIKDCQKNFDKGFIVVLKNNKKYIESKKNITDTNTLDCFKYYIK